MRQAIIFKSRWGWIGVSETTKGINAIVLPKASRQAVLSELQASPAELLDGQVSSRLREARAQLIDYLAGTRWTSHEGRVFNRRSGGPFDKSPTASFDPINGSLFVWGADSMPVPSAMPWGRIRCRS